MFRRHRSRELDRDVPDQAGPVLTDRLDVEQADPIDRVITERVGSSEQLIPAAHPEHDRSCRRRPAQTVGFALEEILGAPPLI